MFSVSASLLSVVHSHFDQGRELFQKDFDADLKSWFLSSERKTLLSKNTIKKFNLTVTKVLEIKWIIPCLFPEPHGANVKPYDDQKNFLISLFNSHWTYLVCISFH